MRFSAMHSITFLLLWVSGLSAVTTNYYEGEYFTGGSDCEVSTERFPYIRDGYLDGEAKNTPAGWHIEGLTGLTEKAEEALKKAPSIKETDWDRHIEITAKHTVPAYAADYWRKRCPEILDTDFGAAM